MGAINTWVRPEGRSFAASLYLYGLLLRLVTLCALWVVAFHKLGHLLIVAGIILSDMTVFGWQCSQYAKTAKRHFLQTGRFFSWLGGYVLMIFLGLASIIQWWNVSKNVNFTPREWVHEVLEAAPPAEEETDHPRFQLHLSGDRKTLSFSGVFDRAGVIAVENMVRDHRRIETIVFDSTGGDLFAARDIARVISERGLNTRSDRMCSATCVIPFAAGIERSLGIGAELGFHAYGLDFLKLNPYVDVAKERTVDRRFLQSRDISPDFLDRMFAPERALLWFPSRFELAQAGVLNDG